MYIYIYIWVIWSKEIARVPGTELPDDEYIVFLQIPALLPRRRRNGYVQEATEKSPSEYDGMACSVSTSLEVSLLWPARELIVVARHCHVIGLDRRSYILYIYIYYIHIKCINIRVYIYIYI